MITVINEYTGMSADKPRKEIIASSSDELDDAVAGHGSIGYSIEDATLNIYDEENEEWTEVPTGGGGLPSVTSADNGKVLAVKNGAWTADANTFVITVSGSPKTIDKTVSEILTALDAGKVVYLVDGTRTYTYLGKDNADIYFASEYFGTNRFYAYIDISNAQYTLVTYPKLPLAFSSDNGSELIVKNGIWAKQQKKFVVTFTPTEQDLSGTMDKTPAEITAAYEAGQDIVFDIPSLSVSCNAMEFAVVDGIIQAGAIVTYRMDSSNLLIEILTNNITSGYETHVYTLTPVS